jgi:hypothetical protein
MYRQILMCEGYYFLISETLSIDVRDRTCVILKICRTDFYRPLIEGSFLGETSDDSYSVELTSECKCC